MIKSLQASKAGPPGELRRTLRKYRQASKAEETKRALGKNWNAFDGWCGERGFSTLPAAAATLEAYLVDLAERGLKAATIEQARWAVNARHKLAGLPLPGDTEQVRVVMAGIRRTVGTAQHRKEALTIDHIRQVRFGERLTGKRDKALLLLGFAGGFRRSELAALRAEQIEFGGGGLRVHLQRSKTDQEGRGEIVDIVRGKSAECCPVAALADWLAATGIESGPLFRSVTRWGGLGAKLSTVSIGKVVKRAAAACGFDPAAFGGHSLRAGCATYLLERGVPLNVVAKQGRWKRTDTVLRYDRGATVRALEGVY